MKTVPIISWNHTWGVVQNLVLGIGQAISRAGFKVIHLRYGNPELADEVRAALAEPEIAFALSLGTYPIFEMNGEPIWKFFPARTFAYFQDPPIYELGLPQTWGLLKEKTGRIAFGFTDADYLDIMGSVIRAHGGGGHSLFLPVATPRPERASVTPWRERPYKIMYFGAIGAEVFRTHIRDQIPESFAAHRNGFVPFDQLVEAIAGLLARGTGGNVTAHLLARLSVGPEVLSDPKWFMLLGEVDSFVKRHRKIQIVRQLEGYEVHLFGHGWESLAKDIPGFVVHGPLPDWTDHFDVLDKTRITLNIDPNFNNGVRAVCDQSGS